MPPPNTPDRPLTPPPLDLDWHLREDNTPISPSSYLIYNTPTTPHFDPAQQDVLIPEPAQEVSPTVPSQSFPLPLVPAHTLIRRRPLQHQRQEQLPRFEIAAKTSVDLRGLDYITKVDENLICPICRIAFINPITTSCDHVFCKDCFEQSYRISATCPVDRTPIRSQDIGPTHRLILNQLDGLEVKCPHSADGCEKVLARSMVQNHVDKYCEHALVSCPERECEGKVPRKDIASGCLHYATSCPDCSESLLEVDMKRHRAAECSERKTTCEKCGVEILRYRADDHENECQESEAACKWAIFGCPYKSKRKELPDHDPSCGLKVMGPVVENLRGEILDLRQEVQFLKEKDKAKDRRLKFVEHERSMAAASANELGYPVPDISDLPGPSSSSMGYGPHDSRDQYLLSLLEAHERNLDQLSLGMTELEAKQTMMLFNETIPIKEQLAELRSNQGFLNMQVRWLINFRLQERRPGAAANLNNEPRPGAGAGGPHMPPMRRSSDVMREVTTKL
jgi:TNF receptor-associated factor 5